MHTINGTRKQCIFIFNRCLISRLLQPTTKLTLFPSVCIPIESNFRFSHTCPPSIFPMRSFRDAIILASDDISSLRSPKNSPCTCSNFSSVFVISASNPFISISSVSMLFQYDNTGRYRCIVKKVCRESNNCINISGGLYFNRTIKLTVLN